MTETEPHKIVDDGGTEHVQRAFSIDAAPKKKVGRPRKGTRVKVYNKYRARVFLLDGSFLEPESEGTVSPEDMKVPGIQRKVIEVK